MRAANDLPALSPPTGTPLALAALAVGAVARAQADTDRHLATVSGVQGIVGLRGVGLSMSDPNGRVVDETSRDVILERARCIGIVTATLERLPGDSFVRSILLDLIEDMEARRLMPEKAGTTHGDS